MQKTSMAAIADINTIWRNIREIDLQSFREEALREVVIAVVGEPGSGRHTLADSLRRDPSRPDIKALTPVLILDLVEAQQPFRANLIVVILDSRRQEFVSEMALATSLNNQGKKVIIFRNLIEPLAFEEVHLSWPASHLVTGSVLDAQFLQKVFAPLVMQLLPNHLLAIGRQFPLFRVPIAHHLINETCFSNATYALGTGLAKVVTALNLPLTVADMVVLTKSQAFLVYKLGLVFGFSLQWRDYLAEFGSVIGGGFVWRQLARSLVGLIPVLGIVPKIAVSYSGTYVVGHTVLQWYLTGRHLSAQQMKALSVHAFQRGQEAAKRITAKMRRTSPKREKKKVKKAGQPALEAAEGQALLAAGGVDSQGSVHPTPKAPKKRFGWGKKEKPEQAARKVKKPTTKIQKKSVTKGEQTIHDEVKLCPQCGRTNAVDANFCQYCGSPFDSNEVVSDTDLAKDLKGG